MRSLIFGATGQIGALIAAECDRRDDAVLGTWYRRPHADHVPLDICDDQSVRAIVDDFQPDTIYLAAGMNQIDYAETHPQECHEVNVDGVINVVRAIEDSPIRLVYVSTGLVFGECSVARNEQAPVEPMNALGRCAVAAESIIRDRLPERHLILRTSWVYGPEYRGKNPAARILRRLGEGQPIEATNDRQCQPTYGPDFASATVELVGRDCRGTYHLVGPDRISEFAFHQTAAILFGFDADLIECVAVADLGEDAPRPGSLWLDRYKQRTELGAQALRGPAAGLRAMRELELPARSTRAA